jgi:hypothetical protein
VLATSARNMLTREHRNVQVESMETLDRAVNVLKSGGFINYYGKLQYHASVATLEPMGYRDAEIWDRVNSNPPDWPGTASIGLA